MSYLKKRRSALGFALSGCRQALSSEPHLKIHMLAALIVTNAGFYFSISQSEWFAVLGCIMLVICLELANSAIEKLCDVLVPQEHPGIKYVKDVAAGAVLVACTGAVIIGVMVFWKYIRMLF